jgi:hypothetical protein
MIALQTQNKNTDLLTINPINQRIIDCHLQGLDQSEIAQFISTLENANVIDANPMASGKTNLAGALAQIFHHNEFLAIAHRISLTYGLENTLHLNHYLKIAPSEWVNNLVVCLNSIPAYHTDKGFKTTVVDEFRQNLETMLSANTIDDKRKVFEVFKNTLNNSERNVLLDADINDFCINFLLNHTNKTIYRIHRDNYTITEREIIEVRNENVIRKKCLEVYQVDKTAMVAVSTVKTGDQLVKYLTEKGVSREEILYKSSDTRTDAEIRAFDANPNEEIKNYKFFIYTPAITSGFSIIEPHFDYHFAMFSPVLQSNENLQMIARDRTATKIYCSFSSGNTKRPTNPFRFIDGFKKQRERLVFNGTEMTVQLDELELLQVQLAVQYNEDLNNYRENFFSHAENNHYRTKVYDPANDANKIDDESQNGLAERVLAEKVSRIFSSEVLDEMQAKILEEAQKLQGITLLQKEALHRFNTTKMYGASSISPYDVERYLKGDLKVILRHESLETPDINLIQSDTLKWQKNGKFNSDFGVAKIAKQIIECLEDETIGIEKARQAIGILATNADELIANGFGDYTNKIHAERPIATLRNFLAKFGHKLEFLKHLRHGEKRERVYKLIQVEYIAKCVERRKLAILELGNINGNVSLRNNKSATVPEQEKYGLSDKIKSILGIFQPAYDNFEFAT